MDPLLEENIQLRKAIDELVEVIKVQEETINQYEENWVLKLHGDLDFIFKTYTDITNPTPVTIKGSFKNESYNYDIDLKNVVLIDGKGRTKKLVLNKPIANQGSTLHDTNVVYYEGDFKTLIPLLDKGKFFLCQVNRSSFVNFAYYNLQGEMATTDVFADKPHLIDLTELKISNKKYINEFIERKRTYESISSLRKEQVRDILSLLKGVAR